MIRVSAARIVEDSPRATPARSWSAPSAADHDLAGVARGLSSTMRAALTLIIPFALLLPLIAYDLANLAYGWLAAAEAFPDYVLPMSLFAIGLVFFTVHYLMLRGYYSLERTRTVFWVQCVIAATNIVLLYTSPSPRDGLLSRMPSS